MTDRNKFEQMLEALINEETEKAKEIFHDIVVEKSRDIYESLLESDFTEEEDPMAAANAEMPEDEAAMEGGEEEGEEEEGEEEGADEFGGDEEGSDEEGGEEMSDDEQSDRILDLEDALEELKAEFEQLMAGEEGEGHHDDMGDMGGDATDDFMGDIEDEPVDEFAFEDSEEEEEEEEGTLREYTEKVTAKMGDNGVNTKSPVAKPNKMGGTTANIVRGGESHTGGTKGGLLNPSTKEEDFGNLNTAKSPKGGKAFSTKVAAGHGAEKKGAGEHADNKKSIIGGK